MPAVQIKPGESLDAAMRSQEPTPKELQLEAEKAAANMEELRAECETPAARVERAQEIKDQANTYFSSDRSVLALQGYLTSIWLLKHGDPPPVRALTRREHPTGSDTIAALGAGVPPTAGAPPEPEATQLLRRTLHLNVAAAALRLSDWAAARAACEFVLDGCPQNPKAIFRLAKAHEGAGELAKASNALHELLEVPGQARGQHLLPLAPIQKKAAPRYTCHTLVTVHTAHARARYRS